MEEEERPRPHSPHRLNEERFQQLCFAMMAIQARRDGTVWKMMERQWHNTTGEQPQKSYLSASDDQVKGAGPPFVWWSSSHQIPAPDLNVHVGTDKDGGPLYVGRAWHKGHLLPAKVAPTHHGAFVAWNGKEHSKFLNNFELLHVLRGRAEWIQASDGEVPAQAYPIGVTMDGCKLYVARVHHDGTVTPGRLMENDYCYISYGGEEVPFRSYEVLAIM